MSDGKKTDKVTWLFVSALLVGAVIMGWQEVNSDILPEGSEAPPFIVERLNGEKVALTSLRGRVVVVNFWATWCGYCIKEFPYLLKMVEELEPQGVTLVAISNDDLDTQREVVPPFLEKMPALAKWAVLGRPEVGATYHVQALPSVYVIDRKGNLVASHQGQATESQLRRWITRALEKN